MKLVEYRIELLFDYVIISADLLKFVYFCVVDVMHKLKLFFLLDPLLMAVST